MPMIGAKTPDPLGSKLLHDWIASLQEKEAPEPGIDSLPAALRLQHLISTGDIAGAEAEEWVIKAKTLGNLFVSGLFSPP
jgi:hypothetical protein